MNVRYHVVFNDGYVSAPYSDKHTAITFAQVWLHNIKVINNEDWNHLTPACIVTVRDKPKPKLFEPYYFLELEYRL